MGRDKVLGLSLAILLMGFAAAFCFRNEQFVADGLKLARAKLLDDAIAERPGPKPYGPDPKLERRSVASVPVTLGKIESLDSSPFAEIARADRGEQQRKKVDSSTSYSGIDDRPSSGEPVASTSGIPVSIPSYRAPLTSDPPKSSVDSAVTVDDSGFKPSPPQESIAAGEPPFSEIDTRLPTVVVPQRQQPIASSNVNRQLNVVWQPASSRRERAEGEDANAADEPLPPMLHRVQRGDTLIRIAQLYYGNGNRYQEIYEANRDQLGSPNDRLRVGMSLRIPRQSKSTPLEGPVAGRRGIPNRGAMARIPAHPRQAPIRNVSRARPQSPAAAVGGHAKSSLDPWSGAQIDADKLNREIGKGDSGSAEGPGSSPANPSDRSPSSSRSQRGRTLSQRPPDNADFTPVDTLNRESKPGDGSRDDNPDMSQYQYFPKGETSIVIRSRPTVRREVVPSVVRRAHQYASQQALRDRTDVFRDPAREPRIEESNRTRMFDPSVIAEKERSEMIR